jgi:hypothetical protein
MISQQEAGQKLRRARERLGLRFRDVKESTQRLAQAYGNAEFQIGLSRLADIETKGTVPSLFRLYSLCVIYKLNFTVVLRWYGIKLDDLPLDAARYGLQNTLSFDLDIPDSLEVEIPQSVSSELEFKQTTFLGAQIHQWGIVSTALLKRLNVRKGRFGFMGTEDWSMWPIIPPGSFLQIDDRRTKPATDTWQTEFDRPIYLLEHRLGFQCGWCNHHEDKLIVQSHPSYQESPRVYRYPGEVDIVGLVIGIAMRMGLVKRPHTHS